MDSGDNFCYLRTPEPPDILDSDQLDDDMIARLTLEGVWCTDSFGKGEPRFKIGERTDAPGVTIWIGLWRRNRDLTVRLFARVPSTDDDISDNSMDHRWIRCTQKAISIKPKNIDLKFNFVEDWSSYGVDYAHTPETRRGAVTEYHSFLVHLCKLNIDRTSTCLWEHLKDALTLKDEQNSTLNPYRPYFGTEALIMNWVRVYPLLSTDREVWRAFNHDAQPDWKRLDLLTCLRVKLAHERLFRGPAPPVRLLHRMMRHKRRDGLDACDKTEVYHEWLEYEDRLQEQGQSSYPRLCNWGAARS